MLVLILGLVEDGVEFEGPGEGEGEGEGEGDGFRVGNVNVGNISDVDAGADSDGTSNGLSAVVGNAESHDGT